MKNKKGFIQIPLLIAIIAGFLFVGSAGYVGVREYQNNKIESPQLSEIDKLKQEVADLKIKDEERGKIIKELGTQKSETISKPTSISASTKPTTPKTSEATPIPEPAVIPSQTKTEASEPQSTQSTVQPPSNTTNITPAPTTQTQTSTTIQILLVNITSSLSSAQIEWQTNIPTNSKIFLSGGNFSSKVYSSESGLSTRHIVNATGLTSGTTYSYKIESIAGDQVVKKQGSFATKLDEYTVSIQPDKTSVQATGWNGVTLKVSTLKNGQIQSNQSVSMVTPDSTQNDTRTTSNLTSTGSGDWHNTFTYYPKTVGTHKLLFSWSGISKSVDIQAVEYVKTDPKIELRTVYQQDANNSSYPVEIPEYPIGYQNATIAVFGLSNADEPFRIGDIKFESDIDTNKLQAFAGSSLINIFGHDAPLNSIGTQYSIKISNTTGIPIGTHTFTIKEIRAIGLTSGLYRTVFGLPITFTFKVK